MCERKRTVSIGSGAHQELKGDLSLDTPGRDRSTRPMRPSNQLWGSASNACGPFQGVSDCDAGGMGSRRVPRHIQAPPWQVDHYDDPLPAPFTTMHRINRHSTDESCSVMKDMSQGHLVGHVQQDICPFLVCQGHTHLFIELMCVPVP